MAEKQDGSVKLFDLSKGGVPLLAALGLLVFVGGACIRIGIALADYGKQQSEIVNLANEVAGLQKTLIALRPENQWTRTDQVLFCWEAERANPNWRCPAIKTGWTEGAVKDTAARHQ